MAKKEKYEGVLILSATLSGEARQKNLDGFSSTIQHFGGVFCRSLDMVRKKLAYPIGVHREGYYVFTYFELDPKALVELTQECQHNEDIIRFMFVKTDKEIETLEFQNPEIS